LFCFIHFEHQKKREKSENRLQKRLKKKLEPAPRKQTALLDRQALQKWLFLII